MTTLSVALLTVFNLIGQDDTSSAWNFLKPGFEKLVAEEYKDAAAAWLKDSSIGFEQITKISNALKEVSEKLGKPQGFELVQEFALTDRVRAIDAVACFQKGPFWLSFKFFRSGDTWRVIGYQGSLDRKEILNDTRMLLPSFIVHSTPGPKTSAWSFLKGGFDALAAGKYEETVGTWFEDSPIAEYSGKFLTGLRQLGQLQGRMTGYALVRELEITDAVHAVFGVGYGEKGPWWIHFTCYKSGSKWRVIRFLLNTSFQEVITDDAMHLLFSSVAPKESQAWAYLKEGFEKFTAGKDKEAVDAWLKDSPLSLADAARFGTAVAQAERDFGTPIDYALVHEFALNEHVHLVFAVSSLTKTPLWFKFLCQRTKSGWKVASADSSVKRAEILSDPQILLVSKLSPVREQGEAWEFLKEGMDKLVQGTPEEALSAWLKGSPIPAEQAGKLAPAVKETFNQWGKPDDYALIREHALTQRVHLVYAVVNLKKSPCWVTCACFQSPEGWIVTSISFNLNLQELLGPAQVRLVLSSRVQNKEGPAWKSLKPGVDELAAGNEDKAIEAWLKDSIIEPDQVTKAAGAFAQALKDLGKPDGCTFIRELNLSESYHIVYAAVNFESDPVWLKFACFKIKGAWRVTGVRYNTKLSEAFDDIEMLLLFKKS